MLAISGWVAATKASKSVAAYASRIRMTVVPSRSSRKNRAF